MIMRGAKKEKWLCVCPGVSRDIGTWDFGTSGLHFCLVAQGLGETLAFGFGTALYVGERFEHVFLQWSFVLCV